MARTPNKQLTPKQRVFLDTYLQNGGQVGKAAFAAGYGTSADSQYAYVAGTRLLNKDLVRQGIKDFLDKQQEATLVTKERIIQEFAHMAFDRSLRPVDRHKSLESLARIEGMFEDRVTHTVQLAPEERERRINELLSIGARRAQIEAPATVMMLPAPEGALTEPEEE